MMHSSIIILLVLSICLFPSSCFRFGSLSVDTIRLGSKVINRHGRRIAFVGNPNIKPIRSAIIDNSLTGIVEFDNSTSYASSIILLSKAIIGSGVWALPSALAGAGVTFTAKYAVILLSVVGFLSGYSFFSIGSSCGYFGVNSYAEIWSKSMAGLRVCMNPVKYMTAIHSLLSCIGYLVIIGNSFHKLLVDFAPMSQPFASRNYVLMLIVAVALLPLSLQSKTGAILFTSVSGLVCSLYAISYMVWSYFKSKSRLLAHEIEVFDKRSANVRGVLSLLSVISSAFVAHNHAPRFWNDVSSRNRKLQKFRSIIVASFGLATVAYIAVMLAGYFTFGCSSDAFILNNYPISDWGAKAARVAVSLTLLTNFPLVFLGLRDRVRDILPIEIVSDVSKEIFLTISLLVTVTIIAFQISDTSAVVRSAGRFSGAALVFIFPAIINLRRAQLCAAGNGKSSSQLVEMGINLLLLGIGAILLGDIVFSAIYQLIAFGLAYFFGLQTGGK